MKRALKILGTLLVILAAMAFLGVGFVWVLQTPVVLAFGWLKYLRDTLPTIVPNWALIAAGVSALCAAVVAFHAIARTVSRGAWQAKWTFLWSGLVVFMFAIGAAAIGVVHQSAWLATMPDDFTQKDPRWRVMTGLAHLNGAAMGFVAEHERAPDLHEMKELVKDPKRWIDPWGTPYEYSVQKEGPAEIRSGGPDRKLGTDDDVVRSLTLPSSTP